MRALAFGTYDVRKHPRVGVLIDGLRAHGIEVDEVNAPLRLSTAERVAMLRQPWRLPVLAIRLLRCWARLWRDSRPARRGAQPDVVLVGYLGHFDVLLARRLFPRSVVVLDHLVSGADTARDRGESGGVKQVLLRRLDRAATSAADIVVVDTEESRDRLPSQARPRGLVVPVGASRAWFDAGERASGPEDALGTATPLRVVFFGLFTPLQGTMIIARALAQVPADEVVAELVGTGQDHPEVRRVLTGRAGVTWHDWVGGDELPDLVAGHDVCLGIFGDNAKAVTVVPTKVYQGAAAGCAVVTSDTPPQRRLLGEAAVLVPPGDPAALAAALRALAADRGEVRRLRVAARALAAREFTPRAAVAPLARRLTVDSSRVHAIRPSLDEEP